MGRAASLLQRIPAAIDRHCRARALVAQARKSVPPDIVEDLNGLSEWNSLLSRFPAIADRAYIQSIVDYGRVAGVENALMGTIAPKDVRVTDKNYREGFIARRLSPRKRALLEITAQLATPASRIYCHETVTPFALFMREHFPHFSGAESAGDPGGKEKFCPERLPGDAFDLIQSNDVLEHMPDLPQALREAARILRPGGSLIATFPFIPARQAATVKAYIKDGAVVHMGEPEYHKNSLDPQNPWLVFQVPGWDILDTAKAAGFREAKMRFWSSHARGFTMQNLAGVFVFVARK